MSEGVNLFRKFVSEMDDMLRENEEVNGKSQRQLLNELFRLENEFKRILLASQSGHVSYKKFMNFILNNKKNKLSVRPYFRERQDTFSDRMFPILKEGNPRKLHRFRINYLFAKWVLDKDKNGVNHYNGRSRARLQKTYEAILQHRQLLCENNLPLAIHWAKRFWSNVPHNHVEYMDLIQDSGKGLLEAIDNFVPPYKTVFRSTAIGRMGLNMSEDYSSTLIKLSPKDRRILYRVRMARKNNENITEEELVKFVNESFNGVTASYIAELEAATTSVASLDYSSEGSRPMSETVGDPDSEIDKVENKELRTKLTVQLERLKLIEKKVLVMKHGEMYGIITED
jgi:DNA-directed RNA polymerase specialized sigma subunit